MSVSKHGWISVDKKWPPQKSGMLLITNNIRARDAFKHYSHVWMVHGIYRAAGLVVAYDEADHRIEGITHWRPAFPEEW